MRPLGRPGLNHIRPPCLESYAEVEEGSRLPRWAFVSLHCGILLCNSTLEMGYCQGTRRQMSSYHLQLPLRTSRVGTRPNEVDRTWAPFRPGGYAFQTADEAQRVGMLEQPSEGARVEPSRDKAFFRPDPSESTVVGRGSTMAQVLLRIHSPAQVRSVSG